MHGMNVKFLFYSNFRAILGRGSDEQRTTRVGVTDMADIWRSFLNEISGVVD